MTDCKRKFERFNFPLDVSFRPTYGATDFSKGRLKNISCSGLSLEVKDFSFIKYENLELHLKFPQHSDVISIEGSVVWKRQFDNMSHAGIKLKSVEGECKTQLVERMASFGDISSERIQKGDQNDPKQISNQQEVSNSMAPKRKKRASKKVRKKGFTKQYVNGGSKCLVTFRLPAEAAPHARKVMIVGDFNDWNSTNMPMKQVKRGDYLVTVELHSSKEYRFKYLIDDNTWENDWNADAYVANDFGSDDSVVIV